MVVDVFRYPAVQAISGIKRNILGFLASLAFLVAALGVVAAVIGN